VTNFIQRGWKSQSLIEIATLQRGYDLPVKQRIPGDFPVFAANGPIGTHNKPKVSGPGVVTGRSGSIGKVHYVNKDFWPLNTALYVKDFHQNYPRFVYYLLQNLHLENYSEGTGVPTLNRNNIHEIKLLLPPITEQKRIAAILDKADALRENRRQAIAKLDNLLQSVFLDMFGDPVTNPKGWNVVPLEKVGSLDRGVSKHRPRNAPELLEGPYPLIQTGDVANSGGYIRNYARTYSELGLKQSKMWPKGTLCITIAANIANTGILTFDACFPDSVVGFVPNKNATIEYIQHLFCFLQKILEEKAPQVAQKNINLLILRSLPIPLPDISEQQLFSETEKKIVNEKEQHKKQLLSLNILFASLQHRAFKGEL